MEKQIKIAEHIITALMIAFTATGLLYYFLKDYKTAANHFGAVCSIVCLGLLASKYLKNKHYEKRN